MTHRTQLARLCSQQILIGLFLFGFFSTSAFALKNNPRAVALARELKPAPLTKGSVGDLQPTGERLLRILTILKASSQSNGPSAPDLLNRAYNLREDLNGSLQSSCQVNIHRQFEQAQLLGLFDEKGKLQRKISKGRDTGKDVQFEYVVPLNVCPEFSKSLANIRLIGPSDVRTSDKPYDLDARTVETAKRYMKIAESMGVHRAAEKVDAARESRAKGLYDMGMTKAEHHKIWQERVDKDPEVLKNKPNIHSLVRKTVTRVGYGRHEITAHLNNRCLHPTEIEIELVMIGIDLLKDNKPFSLRTHKEKIKLLENETREVILDGHTILKKNRKGKIIEHSRYRGWALIIDHDGEHLATTASNPTILRDYQLEPPKPPTSRPK